MEWNMFILKKISIKQVCFFVNIDVHCFKPNLKLNEIVSVYTSRFPANGYSINASPGNTLDYWIHSIFMTAFQPIRCRASLWTYFLQLMHVHCILLLTLRSWVLVHCSASFCWSFGLCSNQKWWKHQEFYTSLIHSLKQTYTHTMASEINLTYAIASHICLGLCRGWRSWGPWYSWFLNALAGSSRKCCLLWSFPLLLFCVPAYAK